MRKLWTAVTQTVAGLTITLLYFFRVIENEPYAFLAPLVGAGLLVDGCRDLYAMRSRRQERQEGQ